MPCFMKLTVTGTKKDVQHVKKYCLPVLGIRDVYNFISDPGSRDKKALDPHHCYEPLKVLSSEIDQAEIRLIR